MGTANFGIAGLDWQQRVNWDRMKKYRTERAREHMKKHGLGAMLCMIGSSLQCCAFASVAPIFRLPTGGIVRKYLTGGLDEADQHILDVAMKLFETRDMQHGVSVLLDHGVRRLAELARFTGR